MKPVGLTCKKDGELMVVHSCLNCGKIVSNRIAGDDNTYVITSLLDNYVNQTCKGMALLDKNDKEMVLTVLYGNDYPKKFEIGTDLEDN